MVFPRFAISGLCRGSAGSQLLVFSQGKKALGFLQKPFLDSLAPVPPCQNGKHSAVFYQLVGGFATPV